MSLLPPMTREQMAALITRKLPKQLCESCEETDESCPYQMRNKLVFYCNKQRKLNQGTP